MEPVRGAQGISCPGSEGVPGPRFTAGVIQTFTGRGYDFADPDPATVSLDDIAHALSNACRFAGHTSRFCSVAEHSVRVSELVEEWGYGGEGALYALLHDAHEAYVWDCPAPFKPLLGKDFEHFADLADGAIAAHFGLEWVKLKAPVIKQADDAATVAEARLLMKFPPEDWEAWEPRYSKAPVADPFIFPADAVGWPPDLAEEAFHHRAKEVGLV